MSKAMKSSENTTGYTEIKSCTICGLPIKNERLSVDNGWRSMDTAPADDMVILDVGWPYAVIGAWNEHEQQWIYSELEINCVGGNFNDPSFHNEYAETIEVKGWMPLPEVNT